MNQVFINAAFTKAISDYQSSKDKPDGIVFNSFPTVVIRLLMCIYSELDIINPLVTENEDALKDNLKKFGYGATELDTFFNNFQKFCDIDKENESLKIKKANPYFVIVQKQIIDMLICKKLNFHLTDKEINDFYELLYTSDTKNPLRISFNYLTAINNLTEVEEYFKKQMQEKVKIDVPQEKNLVNMRAYEILGYNKETILSMDGSLLEKVNHQVYDFFKIRENAINKDFLLGKAIEEYEKGDAKITTGNGYIDILLVMGVICTVAMLIAIISFVVL